MHPIIKKIVKSMPRLSQEQRKRAIGKMAIGATQGHVSRTLGCSRTTVTRLVRCYRTTDQTNDRAMNARSDVTTEDRYLYGRFTSGTYSFMVTSSKATAFGHVVSRHTVQRRLRAGGIRVYRSYRGSP